VRALLLLLARKEGFRAFAMKFRFFRNTAFRFVAGETLEDAIRIIRQTNQQNMLGALDLLGENTKTQDDANDACREISGALDKIKSEKARCYTSVKLTQLGLDLNPDFAFENLMRVVKHAQDSENFVCVDMEDSRYTQSTLEIVSRTHERLDNVGTVIQAYLYRSEQDVLNMIEKGIRIRLVKGAYLEPERVAFRRKKDTDANYLKLMKLLLARGNYPAIATHDASIISATQEFVRSQSIPRDHFEFQMLYGIRRDLQLRLAQEGYSIRIYIPYGRTWFPYFMRRLAERPANVAFLVRNIFKD
jgi:proline dehydrogenase